MSKNLRPRTTRTRTTTPYIAFGVSFFEDVNSLEICLDSIIGLEKLRKYVKIIAIDGKYKGYPIKHSLSEDGSREVVESYKRQYPDHIELYDYPNLHERFKRQKYVDIGASLGIPFLFILDSDESIECKNVSGFLSELKMIEDVWVDRNKVIDENMDNDDEVPIIPRAAHVYHIKCVELDDLGYVVHSSSVPRLWYKYENMKYSTHSFFQITPKEEGTREKALMVQQTPLFTLRNMQIWHTHQHRNKDREMRRRYYEYERLPRLDGRS